MKVAYIILMIIIIGLGFFLVFDRVRQEGSSPAPMRNNLAPTHPEWVKIYGDSDKSNLYSNVWQLELWSQAAGKHIIEIEKRLDKLEADPNE